jgi:hypothetical protein
MEVTMADREYPALPSSGADGAVIKLSMPVDKVPGGWLAAPPESTGSEAACRPSASAEAALLRLRERGLDALDQEFDV